MIKNLALNKKIKKYKNQLAFDFLFLDLKNL